MAKTATKTSAKLNASARPSQNSKNATTAKPETTPTSALPKSLLNALPSGVSIIKHVQAIEALYPDLVREIAAANKAGAIQLARAFVVLHRLNERMLAEKTGFKQFKALWSETKSVTVPNCFEQSGVDSLPLSEGFRVGTSSTAYASILPDKKPEAYVWLKENDKGDIIQETINSSTLSALAREMAEKNEELPDDLFKVTPLANTSVTKT